MSIGLDGSGSAHPVTPARGDAALRRAALELESAFLSIMLKEAGVGRPAAGFGGGIGEEQFASFLRDAYAKEFASAGGIGLAESIFRSLSQGATKTGSS